MMSGSEDTTGALDKPTHTAADLPCLRVIAGESEGQVIALTQSELVFGRSTSCDLVLALPGLSREHGKFVRPNGLPVRLVDMQSTNGLYVNGTKTREAVLMEGDLIGLESLPIFQFRYHAFHDLEKARRLYERSAGDPISGAFNKRHLLDRVMEELALCRRQNYLCSLLALQPDESIKQPTPEQSQSLLRSMAERLEGGLPTEDLLARWENQTFVALLRGKTLNEAFQFAQKLAKLVSQNPFPATAQRPLPTQLTVSGGVVEFRQDKSAEAFVARALKALASARKKGNTVLRSHK